MISYAPFWRLMEKEQISQYRLIQDHKISAAQLHRLKKNQPVSTETIRQLCLLFSCFRHYGVLSSETGGRVNPIWWFIIKKGLSEREL